MPVTFKVASHAAEPYFPAQPICNIGAETVLQTACREQWEQCGELLQSSIDSRELSALVPQGNGFVQAVLTAYKRHHNLIIRPDDVWISILSQLNFYVNAHADELRDYFVAHEGRKILRVSASGSRYTIDYGHMSRQMTSKIHGEVVDKTLADWILPNFTTTTANDTTVCAVLMMSSLKSFFDYRMAAICGIPSVTLEGAREDWQALADRVGRLPELGAQPAVWARMLRPVLARFVSAFDGEPDVAFWESVSHAQPRFYGGDMSGWITAFCVWTAEGEWQGGTLSDITSPRPLESVPEHQKEYYARRYLLDGISYPALAVSQITQGFCEVDVLLEDSGVEYPCMMVAGHVAFAVSAGIPSEGEERLGVRRRARDTLRPSPQWFMFIKGARGSSEQRARESILNSPYLEHAQKRRSCCDACVVG